MTTKKDIAKVIDIAENMANTCDPTTVKLIPVNMLTIFQWLDDKEITPDHFKVLANRIRRISDKFSDNCKCMGVK